MLEYVMMIPSAVLGHNVLGYLELRDIIQFQNAAASGDSQQLLNSILPYNPPITISKTLKEFKPEVCGWFNKRRCRVQAIKIAIESLLDIDFEHSALDSIELCCNQNVTLNDVESLQNASIMERVTSLNIQGDQDPAVMEVLFSLLSGVHSLDINSSNLSQWMEHIEKIGPYLRELSMDFCPSKLSVLQSIADHCPCLEKLILSTVLGTSTGNIIHSVCARFPHLHCLGVGYIEYTSSVEADADLTAFAKKCPQLEELSLNCEQLTDQSVIALAQHCSRLKKLQLEGCKLTATPLIALSERGLPLKELVIPSIPIPSAEIAAQCAHALSRIRELNTKHYYNNINKSLHAIRHMTGLRKLNLDSSADHLLVPYMLQPGQCAGLQRLRIDVRSWFPPQQLSELVTGFPMLHTLYMHKPSCTSDAVLVELTRSCPHLQEVTLWSSGKVTEEGVLALATHCRQLREIDLGRTTVTDETVRQLAQHCRRLTSIIRTNHNQETCGVYYKVWSRRKIRALRELPDTAAL